MARLEGKVAIITGTARGTGAAAARAFVEEGARVVLGDVADEPGKAVAESLGEAARYVHLDVTREEHWESAVALATSELGGLDVLINNAAVLHVASMEDTSREDFERVIAVNQTGAFLGMRAAIAPMKARGGGSIVNVSSIDGLVGMNGVVAYVASKWALRGMTRVAALELGRFGIRVNTVCPSTGSREMTQPFLPTGPALQKLAAGASMSVLKARESAAPDWKLQSVVRMIVFLASDESALCTGADFPVDGGYTAGKILDGFPGSEGAG